MPTKKTSRKEKISLPGGCWCGRLSVYPANWKTSATAMNAGDWYISYRFYDPEHLDAAGKVKPMQRMVKGMNEYWTWPERRSATVLILQSEMELLKDEGYNPITKKYAIKKVACEVEPDTLFLDALTFAKDKIKAGNSVTTNIKSILKHVDKAARHLMYHRLTIGEIRRKHLKGLLEQVGKGNDRWTANTYNHYRRHLSILFNELLEWDAVEFNPLRDLKKQKHVRKIRETLSDEERVLVRDHLNKVYPYFSRTMEIFFHSGVRETELLLVKTQDVDLVKGRFKITLKKGGQPVEQWREIKDVAIDLWQQQMKDAAFDDYVFSYRFVPGKKKPAG